jgi:putative flippase GtrA
LTTAEEKPANLPPRRVALAGLYAAFAAVATGCNLGMQALMDRAYSGSHSVYASLLVGTLVGLVVKYVLDKRFIFRDATRGMARRGWQFVRYAFTGVLTTGIFWGLELGAFHAFHSQPARYLGGALGLAIGYWTKYQLDKRLVFTDSAVTVPDARARTAREAAPQRSNSLDP